MTHQSRVASEISQLAKPFREQAARDALAYRDEGGRRRPASALEWCYRLTQGVNTWQPDIASRISLCRHGRLPPLSSAAEYWFWPTLREVVRGCWACRVVS